MASIEIDGKIFEAENGQMLIEVADAAGIPIPRFCYHEKLSVSANCRMCLVEVENAPKPLPACATPVMDGMKVHTRSDLAREAQKSVMEFLLINHPLDCPICDQGGECELQDVAIAYGQDSSRFSEIKRAVPSKDIGSLIATDMTRCIHCTRCVRFGVEIAGIKEMGAPGRGEHTKITTFLDASINSELSGNMIDVCPVGALTSKPFRFSARAWELTQRDGIAPHDSLGSNIHYHVRGQKVMRVSPKTNEALNEVWLSDRDRFSYQGLQADDRLTQPQIKINGKWQTTDWQTALQAAADQLQHIQSTEGANSLAALTSGASTTEEGYLLQKIIRGLGSNNIDHRLTQIDFSDQNDSPLYAGFGQSPDAMEKINAALIIGSHLRKEQALIHHRLRKAALKDRGLISEQCIADIGVINPIDYDLNLPLKGKLISPPDQMLNDIAGVLKALAENGAELEHKTTELLTSISVNETQAIIAKSLQEAENSSLFIGQIAASHPQFSQIRSLAVQIAKATDSVINYVGFTANHAGLALAGVLPHKTAGGQAANDHGLNAQAILMDSQIKGLILLNLEPEQDAWNSAGVFDKLSQNFVISISPYASDTAKAYADILLPSAAFAETSGSYINALGQQQSFSAAVKAPAEARPAWKILRVLANLLGLDAINYDSSAQITTELADIFSKLDNLNNLQASPLNSLDNNMSAGLQRIGERGLYHIDSLVRRASALQASYDAKISNLIHLHPDQAQELQVFAGQNLIVKQDNNEVSMQVMINEQVPKGTALVYAGTQAHSQLAGCYGVLELSA